MSIQAPGLGSTRRIQGANESSTKGNEIPTPRAVKMHSALKGAWVRAAPTAGAMNGAEQGVATKVASTPVKNDAL